MAVIDTLRPTSVKVNVTGWTAQPGGTLQGVTSDSNDATYAQRTGPAANQALWLNVPAHTPAVGYQRHQMRSVARLSLASGTSLVFLGLGSGGASAGYSYTIASTLAQRSTPWSNDWGLTASLASPNPLPLFTVLSADVTDTFKAHEVWLEVDTRHAPLFAPQVLDATGAPVGVVVDTRTPGLAFGSVDYDGLPAQAWTVEVQDVTGTTVWADSGEGEVPTALTCGVQLDDGSYQAFFTASSLIRGSDVYSSGDYSVEFTVTVTAPPAGPDGLTATMVDGGIEVSWADPGGTPSWDDDYAVAEVWRDDCHGSQRIAVIPDGLTGSFLDRTAPTTGAGTCPESECDITYRVRYWGKQTVTVTTYGHVPDGVIVGWPDAVADIPSGWSRVTDLDGKYLMGSSVDDPTTVTGGAAAHSHTTSGHVHAITSHTHSSGGSTAAASGTTTSKTDHSATAPVVAHVHTVPAAGSTGSGGNSGSASPGTAGADNDPQHAVVVWIASDGTPSTWPVGALAWSVDPVTGWTADATNRFLKGAAPGGDGGAIGGNATHTHVVNDHDHSGLSHVHPNGTSGSTNSTTRNYAFTGSTDPRWSWSHTHVIAFNSASTGNTTTDSGDSTGSATSEPPFRRLRVLSNTTAYLSTGIIAAWRGLASAVSDQLVVCDGTGTTPDMRDLFAREYTGGAVGDTTTVDDHDHTTPTHDHTLGNHAHTVTVQAATITGYQRNTGTPANDESLLAHTHTAPDTATATPAVTDASAGDTNVVSHVPPYEGVHFVRLDVGNIDNDVTFIQSSDFTETSVPALDSDPGMDRLSTDDETLPLCTVSSWTQPRLFSSDQPIVGGLPQVFSTAPGQDLSLKIGVRTTAEMAALEAVLATETVYFTPWGGAPGWYSPRSWSVVPSGASRTRLLSVTLVASAAPTLVEPVTYL
ncbi:MAG: hypothetical protein A2W00_05335 [Candidatus Eisenbacteria bacterium RBG_16_71_46]|nr:MAG: hypothetical protein A2W00_05335 [Candidatus Eisenbacteria bacterium RBG_16_71_46]